MFSLVPYVLVFFFLASKTLIDYCGLKVCVVGIGGTCTYFCVCTGGLGRERSDFMSALMSRVLILGRGRNVAL